MTRLVLKWTRDLRPNRRTTRTVWRSLDSYWGKCFLWSKRSRKTYCVLFVQVHTGQVQLNRGLETKWSLESSCGLEVWENPGADGSKTTHLPAGSVLHLVPPTEPELIPSFDDWTNRTGPTLASSTSWVSLYTFIIFFFFTRCVWRSESTAADWRQHLYKPSIVTKHLISFYFENPQGSLYPDFLSLEDSFT